MNSTYVVAMAISLRSTFYNCLYKKFVKVWSYKIGVSINLGNGKTHVHRRIKIKRILYE